MRLSWLDFRFPVSAIDLAAAADDLGCHRYWLGEHHDPRQSPNPLLLGALLAGTTRGLRLGSGGVCLDYHSPYRIAEDARLIELLLPGRFDLGVTRGLWLPDALRCALLDGREPVAAEDHPGRLAELHGLLTGRLPEGHPLRDHLPFQAGPPMWVLGLGADSARVAGRLGVGFCFSLHHAPEGLDGPAVIEEYRRAFVPSPELPEPEAILVAGLTCAGTEAEARRLTDAYLEESGASRIGRRPELVGDAALCAGRLAELAERFGVGEVMVVDLLPEALEPRLQMQALLAGELGLEPR